MRALTKLLACAVLSAVAGLAVGQPAAEQAKDFKSPGLSAQKWQEVRDLLQQNAPELKLKRAELGVVRAQIRLAKAAPAPDLAAIGLLIDRKAELEAEIEKLALGQSVQLRQLLGDHPFKRLRHSRGRAATR